MKKVIAIAAAIIVALMVLLNGDLDQHEYIEANLAPKAQILKERAVGMTDM